MISGNDVSNNREYGMWISQSNSNTISGNTANGTATVSVWIPPVIIRFPKTLLLLITYPAFTSVQPAAETLFSIITPIIPVMQISTPRTLPGI